MITLIFARRDFNGKKSNSELATELISHAHSALTTAKLEDESGWLETYLARPSHTQVDEMSIVLAEVEKGKAVLEYGSAPFLFTKALSLAGYEVIGTDIAPERFSGLSRLGLNIYKVNYDLDELPCQNDSFDAVVCNEVLEHLRGDLIYTFSEVNRVLKPGGKLLIATPNLKSSIGIYRFLFKDIAYSNASDLHHEWSKIKLFGHMGHVREYTHREVSMLLEPIGFDVEKVIFKARTNGNSVIRQFLRLIENVYPKIRPSMNIILIKQ